MTDEIKPVYQGEAQLVRWADSGAAGRTITLRIDEHTDVHPFKGLKYGDSGQRFEIAVVAKNDDEEPLDPDHAKKNASRHKARPKDGYTRSQMAAILCSDFDFRQWLIKQNPDEWAYVTTNMPDHADATEMADALLKLVLCIKSKKELDLDGSEGLAFDKIKASYDYRGQVRS